MDKMKFGEALEYIANNPKAVLITSPAAHRIMHKRGYHICTSYVDVMTGKYVGGVPIYVKPDMTREAEWYPSDMTFKELQKQQINLVESGEY